MQQTALIISNLIILFEYNFRSNSVETHFKVIQCLRHESESHYFLTLVAGKIRIQPTFALVRVVRGN